MLFENTGRTSEKMPEPLLPAPPIAPKQSPPFKTLVYIFLNCIATIAVVFLNKITFSDPQLKHCQISTTTYHFLTTFVLLQVTSRPPSWLSLFTAKPLKPLFEARWLPIRSILPICTLFALFLILGNLSLTYNPISFYQLAKILTVPTVVLLNFLIFQRTVSLPKLLAVATACIGVAVATGASVQSNPTGAALAMAACCSTALYQIFIGRMLLQPVDGEEVSAPQLLMNQTAVSSAMLCCLVPFFDTIPRFSAIPSRVVLAWFAGGLVAAVINLSQFLIIGSTSVLSFNVVGIFKTVLTLLIAWWTESKVIGLGDAVGVIMAIGASFAYAQIRT